MLVVDGLSTRDEAYGQQQIDGGIVDPHTHRSTKALQSAERPDARGRRCNAILDLPVLPIVSEALKLWHSCAFAPSAVYCDHHRGADSGDWKRHPR